MHNLIAVILYTYLLGMLPDVLFSGDDALYFAMYARDLQCALWISYGFCLIPPKRIIERTICLVFFIYVAVEAQQYFVYLAFDYGIYSTTYFIFTVIILTLFLYNLFKPYNHKSDPITEFHNIHLCFWRPGNVATLLPSLLGFAIGGVSIYTRGRLHGFRWSKSKYQDDEVSPKIIEKKFVVLDTGIKSNVITENIFLNLRNVRAGRLRIRCISTIKPLLEHLGSKYNPSGWLELIPAIYSARILKG
jgi:hypothetical protein